MRGFQITFYTQTNRKHGAVSIAEWLLQLAKELGIKGATLLAAQAGFGRNGRMYSTAFIELAEQPQEVTMAVGEEDAARLFARIDEEKLEIFYTKIPVEFGVTGDDVSAAVS